MPLRSRLSRACVVLVSTTAAATGQFAQSGRPVAADGRPGDGFGECVAVDGDTAVVGAPGADDVDPTTPTCVSGAAYVFQRGGGSWVQVQRLVASDQLCRARFGNAVTISGTTLVVGAHWHDGASTIPNTNCDSGAAYVFERVAGVWVEQQRLVPSVWPCGAEFGSSVAIDGDWIVVGAPRHVAPAAYVFQRVGGLWVEHQRIVNSNTAPFDWFGGAVGIRGATIVVGARSAAGVGAPGAGFVFVRGTGSWVEQAILDVGTGNIGGLGSSAAISGDTVALAAVSESCSSTPCLGAACVWRRQGSAWILEVTALESSSTPTDKFGSALALDRDTLVVGDYGATSCDSGALYAYTRTGTAWVGQALAASPPVCGENLGWSAAVSGDVILGGSPPASGLTSNSGAAYAFERANPATATCAGSACPCGNDDLDAGCANSTGAGAQLFAVGSTSILADDLQLRATHLPVFANCLFVMGGAGPPGPVFDGLMCLSAPRWRLPPVQSAGMGSTAAISRPLAASGASWSAGAVVGFQCFYRDPLGPCGARANLTNGLVVTLTP